MTRDELIEKAAPAPAPMDDLTAARVRSALRELDELDPAMVEEFLADPKWGPLLRQALANRRRWSCPWCRCYLYSPAAPDGWRIATPFDRVVSCDRCADLVRFTP